MSEVIHIHKNRVNSKINLILLLIPPVVFALIVAAVVGAYQKQYTASIAKISVLGEQSP